MVKKKPDCIIYPEGRRGEKWLVEMKAVANVKKDHRMQAQVYLLSLGLDQGFLLNFNYKNGDIELEEIFKPDRELRKDVALPSGEKSESSLEEALLNSGKEVMNYLGTEFLYYGTDIYVEAVGVELRLRGWNFHSVTHSVLYKGHSVTDYKYDYVFEDGSVCKIFAYKKEEDVEKQMDEMKTFNSIFGVPGGYVLGIPEKGGEVILRKV